VQGDDLDLAAGLAADQGLERGQAGVGA